MREINRLTAAEVRAKKTPGRYPDGGGLWLQVGKAGNKAWLFRYMLNGRARAMGLGPVITVSLTDARERARKSRQLLLDGVDPIDAKHEAANSRRVAAAKSMTFRQCAEEFLRVSPLAKQWTNDLHRRQWRQSLEDYAYSTLANVSVADIDVALVLKTLLRDNFWIEKRETASRVRGRIERVLHWAKASGFRSGDNPASWDNFRDLLGGRAEKEHFPALPYAELPAFMEQLRQHEGLGHRALELLVLTAARASEAINASWNEIDFDAKVWTIPASRMKGRKQHRIPLSRSAINLLRSLPRINGFLFPGTKGSLHRAALLVNLKAINPAVTVHGFRSSFSDWAREQTNFPRDVVEQALAHAIKDKTEAAYRRGDSLEKRRKLMEAWAQYCCALGNADSNVVQIKQGAR